jgi:serine beta-lactamase-like protein LACTB
VTKPMTATAVLQLSEHGKLDLDAPVQKYCPVFPPKPWSISARQLLGHIGGIRDYRDLDEAINKRHYASIADALTRFKADPLAVQPGTKFLYSSYGYTLLGCVIEGAAGASYAEYMAENVFRPARMHSSQTDDASVVVRNRASGYKKSKEGALENAAVFDPSDRIPAGGILSTAEDLVRFAIAENTGQLLKPGTLQAMWSPQQTIRGIDTGYGLGWGIVKIGSDKAVAHTGDDPGFSSSLILLPDKGIAVAILANLEDVDLAALGRQIATEMLGVPAH